MGGRYYKENESNQISVLDKNNIPMIERYESSKPTTYKLIQLALKNKIPIFVYDDKKTQGTIKDLEEMKKQCLTDEEINKWTNKEIKK